MRRVVQPSPFSVHFCESSALAESRARVGLTNFGDESFREPVRHVNPAYDRDPFALEARASAVETM